MKPSSVQSQSPFPVATLWIKSLRREVGVGQWAGPSAAAGASTLGRGLSGSFELTGLEAVLDSWAGT